MIKAAKAIRNGWWRQSFFYEIRSFLIEKTVFICVRNEEGVVTERMGKTTKRENT